MYFNIKNFSKKYVEHLTSSKNLLQYLGNLKNQSEHIFYKYRSQLLDEENDCIIPVVEKSLQDYAAKHECDFQSSEIAVLIVRGMLNELSTQTRTIIVYRVGAKHVKCEP